MYIVQQQQRQKSLTKTLSPMETLKNFISHNFAFSCKLFINPKFVFAEFHLSDLKFFNKMKAE